MNGPPAHFSAADQRMGHLPAMDGVPPAHFSFQAAAPAVPAGALALNNAPAPNNAPVPVENWMVMDGMVYTLIVTVMMGIGPKDFFSSLDTWATVLYGITMTVVICSFGIGSMTLCCAFMMDSSSNSYRLYRRISGFCARFGLLLFMILLVFYITCSMGRLGWIAGLLFGVLAGGVMTGIWIWAEKSVVAKEDGAP